MRQFIMFDGRAMFDTDGASVLEFIGPRSDLAAAIDFWEGHDAVVVEYLEDPDKPGHLIEESIVGHINEGKDSLLSRIPRQEP
jgi:hypothetical protein